ncbi:P-loop containing nucleoside triphosphate hydrolase protein, partial [Cystobasidium minutum MCA 4210]|uniref:P-loop containing nucleoside triphosphate hydrolase protein n=1 Tax=Cystobasidium minutum MCA 4210 TaxID=1397322 RepID=UPI0034D00184
IILSTNIAETAVTIPNVVNVLDSGLVKEKCFSAEDRASSLVTTRASLISLQQRKGRAGRNLDGAYFCLLGKAQLGAFQKEKMSDIDRVDLSRLIMTVLSLQLRTPLQAIFDALPEPPNPTRLSLFLNNLHANGLLDAHHQLTAAGCVVAYLPVEPSIGKLCIYGLTFRCLGECG